ncbi:DUF3265 domain-containing protein [Vibrio furnissii]|nr:DUF3265 domain-containing protein [Vibrio furnissii]QDC95716.1 DUF3265 domain-containing protein [Vibrio furnissii]
MTNNLRVIRNVCHFCVQLNFVIKVNGISWVVSLLTP